MHSRGSNHWLSSSAFRSQVLVFVLAMFATMAIVDRFQVQLAISVDDMLKIIACREQQKKLAALEMELAAQQEDFVSKN